MSQNCKECGVRITGRSDKVFCSSHCRVSHNNMKYRIIKLNSHRENAGKSLAIRSLKITFELPLCNNCSWGNGSCTCITKIKDMSLGQFISEFKKQG